MEVMALKAVVLPMLMRERREVMVKEIRTAFRGIFQPGRICMVGLLVSRGYGAGYRDV